jgi:hypothetical protein
LGTRRQSIASGRACAAPPASVAMRRWLRNRARAIAATMDIQHGAFRIAAGRERPFAINAVAIDGFTFHVGCDRPG